MLGGCAGTYYGCCEDGLTQATEANGCGIYAEQRRLYVQKVAPLAAPEKVGADAAVVDVSGSGEIAPHGVIFDGNK